MVLEQLPGKIDKITVCSSGQPLGVLTHKLLLSPWLRGSVIIWISQMKSACLKD